ncbi:PAS domain-containing sensor histidine kinase [Ruficoccus sp. ZRK36]|uniref:hybrid sensor histidine kinase/response regulator n=1 Tax=Ruficoccus sp. ZRK36 TaxID=2866311 RepID=UPI001C73988A|nr:PAS domain-containing sensor histidine kinase [Ruficoccus sp. ZRK36]QYY36496.1 PAS domain S-box protein [Ruficoccus sp. ZRK36]
MPSGPGYETLRSLADRLDIAIAVVRNPVETPGEVTVEYVNPAWEHLSGYGRAQVQAAFDLGESRPATFGVLADLVVAGRSEACEMSFSRADGREFWAGVEVLAPEAATGECVLILKDISGQRTEQAQRELDREKLAVTLSSIGEGVITTDVKGAIDYVNREGERLIGQRLEDVAGQPLREIFHLLDAESKAESPLPLERVFRSGQAVGPLADRHLVTADGIERKINFLLSPILDAQDRLTGCVLVFSDITNQVRLERELQKNQRMESIALLSGGIAHDFNNILTGILGNISLARNRCEPQDQLFTILKAAEKAALRARDLTHQLMTFSKGGVPVKNRTCLHELIRESSGFVLSGSNCRCQLSVPEDLWAVEVDEGQIAQVLNNLLINATQAMKKGGRIEIQAENAELGAEPSIPLEPGFYVRVSVSDNGPGIPPEHLARIFDPYFTTKKTGSGLGLATSYSIVKNHDGHIMVDSEPGVGTTFILYLPGLPSASVQAREPEQKLYHGKGRILLMDDEQMIRQIAGDMLTHLGYEVAFAADGDEAIRLYEEAEARENSYDVLIADLTVPGGLGAVEAAERLRSSYPDIKCIVTSGYTNNPVLLNPAQYGFQATIQKPYTIQQLSWVIRSVIAPESAPAGGN